jgi:hypothetical protein
MNQFQQRAELSYNTLYNNTTYTGAYLFLWTYALTKSYVSIWNNFTLDLGERYDYFEPRTQGRYLTIPMSYYESIYFSSDYRKTLAIDFIFNKYGNTSTQNSYFVRISPRIRLSNQLTLRYRADFDWDRGDRGFVNKISTDSIIMGIRNVHTFTNNLSFDYVISNKMYISMDARHYWSKVDYISYHILNADGSLGTEMLNHENANINFNAFNIDLLFSWNFAPGSFLSIVYKNQIYASDDFTQINAFPSAANNLSDMFKTPQQNSLSVKLLYYLDWQYLQ